MDGYHLFLRDVAVIASLASFLAGVVARARVAILTLAMIAITFAATSAYVLCVYPPGVAASISVGTVTTAFVSPIILGVMLIGRSVQSLALRKS